MIEKVKYLYEKLWPICRSITGPGLRDSFSILKEVAPFQLTEVPSGTKVLDWEVPNEWSIKDAWIKDPAGNKIVDFKSNNLHVLGYSEPISKKLPLQELKAHLHTLPELPDAIPYLTSYYKKDWGFCLSHNQLLSLADGLYEVCIDSSLKPGSLTFGEVVIPATVKTDREIFLTSYLCHPSMANNELSGPVVLSLLYDRITQIPVRNFNYRLVIAPETIGAITYLSKWGDQLKKNVECGLVLTCCGDPGSFTYKQTRNPDSKLNRLVQHELGQLKLPFSTRKFVPMGSDERQYCSPGFNLEMGSLTRTMYGEYKEYHTSLDNLSFISFEATVKTVEVYEHLLKCIDSNQSYLNIKPFGEPMLSKYGVYPTLGVRTNSDFKEKMMWLLNLSDGKHDLLSVAEHCGCSMLDLMPVVEMLEKNALLNRLI